MEAKKTIKKKIVQKKKKMVTIGANGKFFITATFNNTIITATNDKGETVAWSSAGAKGFKGARKSTPFAASSAVDEVAKKAGEKGMKAVEVYVKGPGAGRDAALRAIKAAGLSILQISDVTPIPHNGPRPEKRRRV